MLIFLVIPTINNTKKISTTDLVSIKMPFLVFPITFTDPSRDPVTTKCSSVFDNSFPTAPSIELIIDECPFALHTKKINTWQLGGAKIYYFIFYAYFLKTKYLLNDLPGILFSMSQTLILPSKSPVAGLRSDNCVAPNVIHLKGCLLRSMVAENKKIQIWHQCL